MAMSAFDRGFVAMTSLVVLVACGSRTGLDLPSASASASAGGGAGAGAQAGSGGASSTCPPLQHGSDAPCSAWNVSGPDQLVSAQSKELDLELAAPLGVNCDVLVAWNALIGPQPNPATLTWRTRLVGFDGKPRSGLHEHAPLSEPDQGSASMSLAAHDGNVGALVADAPNGCRFVPMDATGKDQALPVSLGAYACGSLAAVDQGFTFLAPSLDGATPVTLQSIDAHGTATTSKLLPTASGRAAWGRIVFDDGSFLLNTFSEDPVTAAYTIWLQRFDASGAPLASEVVTPAKLAPVTLSPSKTGALIAWEAFAENGLVVDVMPVDRNGNASGPIQTLTPATALYAVGLSPVPNGDVSFSWLEYENSSHWKFWVRALAPDGMPRGPATLAIVNTEPDDPHVIVAPDGVHALVTYRGQGIHTLPLACVK